MLGRTAIRASQALTRAALRPAAVSARSFSVPTTADKVVHVTFVNVNGERLRVPAMVGQTVYEVAIDNEVEIGDMMTCHVVLSPESYSAHPKPMREEAELLGKMEEVADTSRMASFLSLSPEVKETYVALTSYRAVYVP
mmetsp:Transcript_7434/g.17063  ORF Transcript_7434/g.17063 Transcript_7434/m.17063 type:complete len:139 (+) Transcript_7434:41-457(+)